MAGFFDSEVFNPKQDSDFNRRRVVDHKEAGSKIKRLRKWMTEADLAEEEARIAAEIAAILEARRPS